MRRIALITYELNQGGTNRVLCALANGFDKAGLAPHIVTCTSAGALDDALRGQLRPGIAVTSLDRTPFRSRGWGQVRNLWRYRAWLRRDRPDIVLATGNNISWLSGIGLLLAGRGATRFYIKTTNPIVRERDGPVTGAIRRAVYGWLFRWSDGVLTLSDRETELLRGQFPKAADRFQTVYNAYLTADFEAPTSVERKPGEPLRLLAVGRLAAQKNFARLLHAFAAVQPADTRMRIAGDGEERAMLQSLAIELGIADKADFLGFRSDVAALMGQSDLLLMSSDYEGLPAVVVEALASNLPVIATDCFANVRDLLEGLPGCAVTERTVDGLAGALRDWLAAPPARPLLRPSAERYSTQSSVASHLEAMERLAR